MKELLDKIKEFFQSAWSLVVVSGGALVVTLLYMLRKKQDENNALKTKDSLHEADKQTALLDQQIDQKREEVARIKGGLAASDEQLKAAERQHKANLDKEKSRPEDEVEEYWKNN